MNNYKWLKKYSIQTVIDIGANRGQYVSYINSIIGDIDIHSFEPIKSVYDELVATSSQYKNVTTYNIGLGDKNENTDINVNEFSPSSSILELEDVHVKNILHTNIGNIASVESIEIRKLDDVLDASNLKKNILIKMDVQGYEDKVIDGGCKILTQCHVAIIEVSFIPMYKGEKVFADINKMMEALGFAFVGNLNQFFNNEDGAPLYSDAIFVNLKLRL